MRFFRHVHIAGVLTSCLLALSVPNLATAAPISAAVAAIAMPQAPITDVRYRRGVPPAAAFGLFGAVLGAAIANSTNDNYNNYSYYAYGQPYGYSGGHARGGGGNRGVRDGQPHGGGHASGHHK